MKRLIAVLSVLILLCTLAGGGSLAQAKSVPQYDNYVALGDSITAGYPLPGFGWQDVHKAKWKLIPNSYAWRVSRAVRAKETSQMAKPGWRTVEMRTMLDKSYPGDTMMRETLPLEEGSTSQLDQKALKKLRHQYRLAIKNADLITVQFGSNDAWKPIQVGRNNLDDPAYVAQIAGIGATCVAGFKVNFDEIIRSIRKLNPDAKLIVVGIYNPFANGALDLGPFTLEYGKVLTDVIKVANAYMEYGCPYADQYEFADVMGIETLNAHHGSPDYVNDPHPTVKGHRQIANKVLAEL